MGKKMFEPIELGDRVSDPISGWSGIVVCITVWLHGCIRIGVQPEEKKDGKPVESIYFDQTQLRMVKKKVHAAHVLSVVPAPEPETRQSSGGPSRETSGFSR